MKEYWRKEAIDSIAEVHEGLGFYTVNHNFIGVKEVCGTFQLYFTDYSERLEPVTKADIKVIMQEFNCEDYFIEATAGSKLTYTKKGYNTTVVSFVAKEMFSRFKAFCDEWWYREYRQVQNDNLVEVLTSIKPRVGKYDYGLDNGYYIHYEGYKVKVTGGVETGITLSLIMNNKRVRIADVELVLVLDGTIHSKGHDKIKSSLISNEYGDWFSVIGNSLFNSYLLKRIEKLFDKQTEGKLLTTAPSIYEGSRLAVANAKKENNPFAVLAALKS